MFRASRTVLGRKSTVYYQYSLPIHFNETRLRYACISCIRYLGHFCISGAFSNSHRSNPSSHPTNNVGRVYAEFFPSFNFVYGGGRENCKKISKMMHCLKKGTEKWKKNMNIALLSQGLLSRIVVQPVYFRTNVRLVNHWIISLSSTAF